MNLGLKNRTAVVTGAARGIGAAIARLFAEEGAHVVVTDIDKVGAEEKAAALTAAGHAALAIPCDVSDPYAVETMRRQTVEAFGGVDILVNNAGFVRDGNIRRMAIEDWDSVIATNLTGPWLCCRTMLPHMVEGGWGRIVNISSRAHWGNPGQSNYSSSKAGVSAGYINGEVVHVSGGRYAG